MASTFNCVARNSRLKSIDCGNPANWKIGGNRLRQNLSSDEPVDCARPMAVRIVDRDRLRDWLDCEVVPGNRPAGLHQHRGHHADLLGLSLGELRQERALARVLRIVTVSALPVTMRGWRRLIGAEGQ
jgi:hypothetical protein